VRDENVFEPGPEPAARHPVLVRVEPDSDPARPMPLAWEQYSAQVLREWRALLDRKPEEREVQAFLELHPAMIPGGCGDIGPGGHHGSAMGAVFREPQLAGAGRSFKPDFMWVTRSTSMFTPILIEIEKPSKPWFTKDGRPSASFTQARDQLNDWRSWFDQDGNKALFRDRFLFLPDPFNNRPLRPQFLLIYGRRSEFEVGGGHENPDELRFKRDLQRAQDEFYMTFDSLSPCYRCQDSMTLTMTTAGPRVHAFSPVYRTGTLIGEGALVLGDPAAALECSAMMADERRAYLAGRWTHWQDHQRRRAAMRDYTGSYATGRE